MMKLCFCKKMLLILWWGILPQDKFYLVWVFQIRERKILIFIYYVFIVWFLFFEILFRLKAIVATGDAGVQVACDWWVLFSE